MLDAKEYKGGWATKSRTAFYSALETDQKVCAQASRLSTLKPTLQLLSDHLHLCTGKDMLWRGTQSSCKAHCDSTFAVASLHQNSSFLCLKTMLMQICTAQDMQLLGNGDV